RPPSLTPYTTLSRSYNASPASSPVSQAVNPAPLSITADPKTKVYGEPNPAFTVSYSGFVLGESNSALGGSLAFATSAITSSPVGSYSITPSGLTSANYTITFHAGTLTVNKASTTTALSSEEHTTELQSRE